MGSKDIKEKSNKKRKSTHSKGKSEKVKKTKTLKMKATVKAGLKSQELPTLLTTIWRM